MQWLIQKKKKNANIQLSFNESNFIYINQAPWIIMFWKIYIVRISQHTFPSDAE